MNRPASNINHVVSNDFMSNTMKLPEVESTGLERVLEWNNQSELTVCTENISRSGPPSPNGGRFRADSEPYGDKSHSASSLLRDDMGIPQTSLINNHSLLTVESQARQNQQQITFPFYIDEPMSVTSDEMEGVFANYLKCHSCYEIVPKSAKIVIFDTRLLVKKAFYALVANGVRSAPLWDNKKQEYVGMLTISDFINILISYYKSPMVHMEELEEHRIETWRELSQSKLPDTLIRIAPYQSLFEACELLIRHGIHRLPVIDPTSSNFLFVISHKRILTYLQEHFSEMYMPHFMSKTLAELGIGTMSNIATITPETPLITALNMFAEHKVSALPIVDKDGVVVDIYARFDVINLAVEKSYNNLDVPVIEALQHRAEGFEGVHHCRLDEPLHAIIDRIVKAGVHRLVVVDDSYHIAGVLSLSDLLRVLVLHPPGVISPTIIE